jgi:hypothetical protein
MSAFSLNQVLALYTWFPLVALLFIYLLVARFYQRFSGVRTFFWLYIIPMILLGASAVRYASVEQLQGDFLGDIFLFSGGAVLMALSTWLFQQMMTNRET